MTNAQIVRLITAVIILTPTGFVAMHSMGLAFLIVIILMLYFLPTYIAVEREHPQVGPIFILNLMLGWSFLGWVGALVWATVSTQSQQVIVIEPPAR